MNKIIFEKKYGQEITEVVISDIEVSFVLKDGSSVAIEAYHSQDCCETVYADFSTMKYHKEELVGKTIMDLVIKGVEGMGFLLCLAEEKIFIACYNSQSGYYSSDLELRIKEQGTTTVVNISNLVEDDVN